MGFWQTLNKMLMSEEVVHKGFPSPTRPAPSIPKIKPSKKDISEPVLSIIRTLRDGEWSHTSYEFVGDPILYFTHEWFGNELAIYIYDQCCNIKNHCTAEWMTQKEKEVVGDVCWQIYQGRVKWEKEKSLAQQRDSYMNLTGEY